jgi:hypothetical protein
MLQSIREFHDNRGGLTFLIGVNELSFSMYLETACYFESQERRGNTCTTSRSTKFAVLISANILYLFP